MSHGSHHQIKKAIDILDNNNDNSSNNEIEDTVDCFSNYTITPGTPCREFSSAVYSFPFNHVNHVIFV